MRIFVGRNKVAGQKPQVRSTCHRNRSSGIAPGRFSNGAMKLSITFLFALTAFLFAFTGCQKSPPALPTEKASLITPLSLEKPAGAIRFATFNVSLNRSAEGELVRELAEPGSQQPSQIAEIIQRVRPDILLLNEFDFDESGQALKHFQQHYLAVSQNSQPAIEYPYTFFAPVNTGLDSGHDLNSDGTMASPDDAFGYGRFPGQYGMVVLSRFPIQTEQVRTFQKFLWCDMPSAQWPVDPATSLPYYDETIRKIFRLSSKSHWDVPIQIEGTTIHFLVSHPTPPVFDGPEDRNGCRNHDEIRFWADYISGADYIYDDRGQGGGLSPNARFVIAGDQNADPSDGESRSKAIAPLLDHERVNASLIPQSNGGIEASHLIGEANERHLGDPAADTSHFSPSVGNLRVDYCLPSRNLTAVAAGIFWPASDEDAHHLATASDHRLVWVDVRE